MGVREGDMMRAKRRWQGLREQIKDGGDGGTEAICWSRNKGGELR